ncbi:hypothetical protein [Mycoplasma mycoides]|uniref:hypothetical protein n=1 Tax=Mycoplasma mycoides TaxID=2102 RepID=UPI0001793F9E|nr:hypothetical protein [Mycoplasma mycoides]SRX58729.1 hypothetical protein MMC68K_00348 [Mycoplasma mycoides subsp. capri]SRX63071.1 hypothetical protein MMC68N_00342 [Mycoplasma mycoides subsp. capri]SRX63684.1 hypothetical protein MMC68D_00343 [Mycoplasma mycoides subsp. capri]SRX64104.1 hypothetical protein MMC68H_00363 [Mycoplasma mycoides subsp. capri]SRX65489.1 hypothetical protein MMC68L_00344 [Mycoplasma mycoides subsp. capri]
MNKLLKLLTLSSFITIAASPVVACIRDKSEEKKPDSNTRPDPTPKPDSSDRNKSILDLIKSFNSQMRDAYNEAVRPYIVSRTAILSKDLDENRSFFSKESIRQLVSERDPNEDKDGYHSFYSNLTNKRKEEFQKTLETVLDIHGAKRLFLEQVKKAGIDKYRILLDNFNNNLVVGFKFKLDNSKMKFLEEDNGSFNSTIKIGLDFNYQYKDGNKQTKREIISNDFIINISSEKAVVELVHNIQKFWSNSLFNNKDLLTVDFKELKKLLNEHESLTAQDLLTATSYNYKNATYLYSQKLADKIKDEISEKLIKNNKNQVVKNLEISYKDPEQKTDEDRIKTELKIGPLERNYNNQDGGSLKEEAYKLLHLYFGEVNKNQKLDLITTKQGDMNLVQDLIEPWVNKLTSFKEVIKQKLTDIYSKFEFLDEKDIVEFSKKFDRDDLLKNLFKSATAIESFELKGLQLKLKSGYIHDLGNINFNYVVQIDQNDRNIDFDNKEKLKYEGYKKSNMFDAYYKGIEIMLEEFHKFYGIRKANPNFPYTTDKDVKTEIHYSQRKNLFNMTGKPSNVEDFEDKDFNIWTEWEKYLNNSNKITDPTSLYSLDFSVDAKKLKNEYLTSNMLGVRNFTIYQDFGGNPYQSLFYKDKDFQTTYNEGFDKVVDFSKGISIVSTRNADLDFGLLTDLLNFRFKAKDFTYNSLQTVTLIGRVDDNTDQQNDNSSNNSENDSNTNE